ncbi:DNA repair protein [Deinococcus sp.]|uniref:DNA repair protein n=1 Tax=Deinococcus sp. TaxID=47478 RepID=UPI0025E5550F|nr:DNA repair protein [Deinococcus sp.]
MTQASKSKKDPSRTAVAEPEQAVNVSASTTAATTAATTASTTASTTGAARTALQSLLRTALPDAELRDLDAGAMSSLLGRAHDLWGLGLRHLRHEVRFEDGGALALYADRSRIGSAQDTPEALAAAYAGLQAQDEQGRSAWAVLPEGHRLSLEPGMRQLRVLIEDARDFETTWAAAGHALFTRTGRQGEALWYEAYRAAPGRELVQDAAWEVVERIKDRSLRRELQRRAEEKGILGALLGARGGGVEAAMQRSPSLHFTVNAAVLRTTERSLDTWKALQKEALGTLEAAQQAQVERLVALLGTPGSRR